ncbi:MAG: hypothetical protein WDO19_15520 [Bacteroidota bacterium]
MSTMSIPAFHVSDQSIVKGSGEIFIASRKDINHSGIFTIKIDVHFNPAADMYPAGALVIKSDLNDGSKGFFKASSVELINSYGRINPTFYITGRCDDDAENNVIGCRYWVLIVSNRNANQDGTADIAGFAIHDRNGQRVAYGTGSVKGDFAGKAE